jgi:hypothetical protein
MTITFYVYSIANTLRADRNSIYAVMRIPELVQKRGAASGKLKEPIRFWNSGRCRLSTTEADEVVVTIMVDVLEEDVCQ